eukprot:gene9439-biopygen174
MGPALLKMPCSARLGGHRLRPLHAIAQNKRAEDGCPPPVSVWGLDEHVKGVRYVPPLWTDVPARQYQNKEQDIRCVYLTVHKDGPAASPRGVGEGGRRGKGQIRNSLWNPQRLSKDSGAGVARAWRGRGAGYMHFLAWVARAWRGHGAGVARACPVTPGSEGDCNAHVCIDVVAKADRSRKGEMMLLCAHRWCRVNHSQWSTWRGSGAGRVPTHSQSECVQTCVHPHALLNQTCLGSRARPGPTRPPGAYLYPHV